MQTHRFGVDNMGDHRSDGVCALTRSDNRGRQVPKMARPLTICCVCGARPNFIKIAPLVEAFAQCGDVHTLLVHTGQHYDKGMSELFFGDLHIPKPDVNLEVGSASHAVQTGDIMRAFEPVCLREKPDWVVVVGDVNSTIACALVAVKLGIKVAHVEAGLRSGDRAMPEEINRILTDAISDLLFVSEPSGLTNLRREGIPDDRVYHVGNVMIDTLMKARSRAEESTILTQLGLTPRRYAVMTLHRPSNVDDVRVFSGILDAMKTITAHMPVVFPIHPRTRHSLAKLGLQDRVDQLPGLRLVEPLGYLDFMKLTVHSAVVLSDSGGIQEETTILGVPCLTLRDNTERPITISEGTNRLTGSDPEAILAAFADVVRERNFAPKIPALWDGTAAERIVDIIMTESVRESASSQELAMTTV